MTQYRAKFGNNRVRAWLFTTRFYSTREQAQNALARRIGHFHHLGHVSGDASIPGQPCNAAPRNGGLVTIEERHQTAPE